MACWDAAWCKMYCFSYRVRLRRSALRCSYGCLTAAIVNPLTPCAVKVKCVDGDGFGSLALCIQRQPVIRRPVSAYVESKTTKALPLFCPCGSDDRASVNQIVKFQMCWDKKEIWDDSGSTRKNLRRIKPRVKNNSSII